MNTECIICYEQLDKKFIFKCSHDICIECYQKMLEYDDILKCPICRNIEKSDDIFEKKDNKIYDLIGSIIIILFLIYM